MTGTIVCSSEMVLEKVVDLAYGAIKKGRRSLTIRGVLYVLKDSVRIVGSDLNPGGMSFDVAIEFIPIL